MKNQDQSSNQIGLSQTNSIFQLWKDLKNSIFNVLFVLLNQSDGDQQQQSLLNLGFETGLDYFQMMSFPFDTAIIQVWSGGQTLQNFTQIFTNLSFSQFIPGVGFSTFLIMLYILIFVIIIVIIDIVYVSYSFSKKKFKYTWPLVFLAKVVPLCVTVFFLPIMETLLSVVSCQNSEEDPGIQVMSSFSDVICWEGWHMFHAVVTLFFTSIFVFIACIVALTIFQPRMTTNQLTARQNSTGQVIFIINKMICQFVFSFTPFQSTWVYCIMLFLLSAWLYNSYNIDQPFYNKDASKFFRICSSYYFWTNLMLFVSRILYDFGFKGGLVIWMCGLPFIGISIIFQRKSNIDKLFSSNLKFRSGEQLQSHLQYVLQLIQNRDKDKNSYMLLLGYIQKHIQICMQQDCPLKIKKIKKQQDLTQIEQNCRQLIKQLLRMYKQGVKKHPECTRLRLSFAFFYMEQLQSNNKAYQEFTIAQGTQPSFGEQFIIYRFKKIIRENLQEKEEDQSNDLIQIIRFDNHVSLCQEAMLMSARLHKQFWTELEEETPDLKKLNSIGSKITQTTITVKQNYKQIQKINRNVPQVINNYALYLIFVQQSHIQGKKILQQVKKIYIQKKQTQQTDMSIFTLPNSSYTSTNIHTIQKTHNSLIKISAQPSTLGKIISSNIAFTQLTGYLKQDITQRNIQKILPSIYSYFHLNTIKLWINNKQKNIIISQNNKYLNNPQKGYIKQKSGFIVPVDYRVSFDVEQCCFRVVMRPDSAAYTDFNCKIYIMTNNKGFVKDISPLGYMYFKIGKEQCERSQYDVENIGIPLLKKKNQIFSKKGLKLRIPQYRKSRTLEQKTFTSLKSNRETINQPQNSQKLQQLKSFQLLQQLSKNPIKNSTSSQNPSQIQQPSEQLSLQTSQQFLIKGEQIWLTSSQQIQQSLYNQIQFLNNKIKIGDIFILQKIKTEFQIYQTNQKNNQLDIYESLIQDIYYQQKYQFQGISQEQNPFQFTKHRKLKILASMLLQMNKGQLITFENKKIRNYGEQLKIKTYRYFNQDYIRIYNIEYENDEDNQYNNQSNQNNVTQKDINKLEQKHYQEKIKIAINTNIQHTEIKFLMWYAVVYLALLIGLVVVGFVGVSREFAEIQKYTNMAYQKANDTRFLTGIIQEAVNKTIYQRDINGNTLQSNNFQKMQIIINQKNILLLLQTHKLTYDPPFSAYCQTQQNSTSYKTILQISNLIQGRILNFFNPLSYNKQLFPAYQNFFISIYPFLQFSQEYSSISLLIIILTLFLTILNTFFILLIWIYSIMKIDQKRFDIMIWFLYIPVDYVIYLQNNCNRFIKNYITIKQLEEKGLNMDDKEQYCDMYLKKNAHIQGQDQENMDQENKARKILIARHRKKTFISRFNTGYLKVCWLMGYSVIVLAVLWVELAYQKSKFQFVLKQWDLLQKEFLWSSSFPIILQLKYQLNIQEFKIKQKTLNLAQFSQVLRKNFLNTLTSHNKVDEINELIDQPIQISQIYSKIYQSDLCSIVIQQHPDPSQQQHLQTLCSSILSSKLRGGLSTYTSYLTNYNPSQISQISLAQSKFVVPAYMIVFSHWKQQLLLSVSSLKTISNIMVYFYVSITILGFLSLWLIYLKGQNTKMNQTIQMLNMIPINMLPKNRRDTRDFLNWLIQQADKKRQESQQG